MRCNKEAVELSLSPTRASRLEESSNAFFGCCPHQLALNSISVRLFSDVHLLSLHQAMQRAKPTNVQEGFVFEEEQPTKLQDPRLAVESLARHGLRQPLESSVPF